MARSPAFAKRHCVAANPIFVDALIDDGVSIEELGRRSLAEQPFTVKETHDLEPRPQVVVGLQFAQDLPQTRVLQK